MRVPPGFCEADLVAHDGGDARGDYCHSLDVTDVATGWTEPRALRNRASRWVHEALADIEQRLPFPLQGLDSDNGAEFINNNLASSLDKRGITFTRSRPCRKNDSCFVEQKNWSVIRRFVGYARYDTEAELESLHELYRSLRLYVTFFLPVMKLTEKIREGAKVRKRYDVARTPYRRVLEHPDLPEEAKAALTAQYLSLNPVRLKMAIGRPQDTLMRLARLKERRRRAQPPRSGRTGRGTTVVAR